MTASRNPRFAVGDHVSGRVRSTGVCADRRPGSDQSGHENRAAAQVSQRAWHDGHDRLFRTSRHGPAKAGRDGGGLGGGGSRGRGRGTDRQNQELPRRRHRGRSGKVRLHRAGVGLRRSHRLQIRRREEVSSDALSAGHRHLFRQRGWHNSGSRAGATGAGRADCDLRGDLAIQQYQPPWRGPATICLCW